MRKLFCILIYTCLSALSFPLWATPLKEHHNVLISRIRQPINGPNQNQQMNDEGSLALTQAFKHYSKAKVTYSPACNSVDCLAGPKSQGYYYYVSPQWVFWNATDPKTQHPSLKIAIYDIRSRQVIATQIINANKSSALIGQPDPILANQVRLTVKALYQQQSEKSTQSPRSK
ncbi:DUF4823 domain-containing protein [Celerinatantimonas diazotrophica]|uniref:Uncharacterized protein DUF4823 n=1 Tax=Celerinatantimonas diazotrophica TaxID=412034 RepID=A0A4R1K4R2_9GAMM|nr:DUF4823 domain-containing protein [Celerinatantimonas diazotrophica]TCK58723.1 uncharacterized protein DUF4823 [Celerinatantimonas diazotrophica]CAG9297354.1 hypothetical protein CEDIAZO_02530 [Celerinatantimonas diazotrophica]